jgi:replication-associated recombination protein RarA
VPLHLRNAITPLMKRVGYGSGYRYVHTDPRAREEMACLPEPLRGKRYYDEEASAVSRQPSTVRNQPSIISEQQSDD